jgi:phosphoserine phosphatase
VCSHVAYADGKCLGRIAGDETRGPIKAESICAHFAGRAVDWPGSRAYSDDIEDAPLWALVGNPVMVAPGGDLPPGVRREVWS